MTSKNAFVEPSNCNCY